MLFFKALPIDEAVYVVDEKSNEAEDHRKIAQVLQSGGKPEGDENEVVQGISERVSGMASVGEINGKEARGDRKSGNSEICRRKGFQNEIEDNGYKKRQKRQKKEFPLFQTGIDTNLGFSFFKGVLQPRDKREDCHRERHTDVGQHFAVIGEAIGNDTVKRAEQDDKDLSNGISFGAENERGHADERGDG